VEHKKKKRKKNYVILVLSDNPMQETKKYSFSTARRNFLYVLLIIMLLMAGGYVVFSTVNNSKAIRLEKTMTTQIAALREENDALVKENQALSDKVSILSETVNQKVSAERELLEKNMPTGFPVAGTAEMSEQVELVNVGNEEVERPMILFEASTGVSVIAAGSGVVTTVKEETEYGYCVIVDHGNGYMTLYRSGTVPKVRENDEVTRSTTIYVMDEDFENGTKVVYQMMKDDSYIAPTEMLEING